MKFSVALCTYNGAKYIEEQIRSILNQTMPVDEIVVCDDGSIDCTIDIVEKLKLTSEIPVIIIQNARNIGFKENFIKAMGLCRGDVIFLSDQDDVWLPDKVEKAISWFDAHPDKEVMFTDAILINENGEILDESLWQRFGFDKKKQKYFDRGYGLDIWAWCNRATGATMALKKDYLKKIDWSIGDGVFHDKTIALQGLIAEVLGYYEEKLIYYRLHGKQACGAKELPKELYNSPLVPCKEGFLDFDLDSLPERERKHVEFIYKRASSKNKWFGFFQFVSIPSYFRMYHGWAYKFYCYDLFVSIRHSIKRVLNQVIR